MIDINYSMFFDKPGVIAKVKDGTKSSLSKAGSFVRTAAQRLIRPRKKPATPGNPPNSHMGLLRKLLFFGYDNITESVVVGPQLLRSTTKTPPPALLEGGGTTTTSKGKPATYRKYPYMAPALESEQGKFPDLFANSVKG